MVLASSNVLAEKLFQIRESLSCPKERSDCSDCNITASDCYAMASYEHGILDLFEFMQQRFKREEEFMRLLDPRRGRDSLFEPHREAHADMMRQISELLVDGSSSASVLVALRRLVDYWLYEHLPAYDAVLESAGLRT